MAVEVLAILTGKVQPFRAPDEPSAIAKSIVDQPVAIGPMGIVGDEQADLVHHGGAEKAIHHYPADHYPWWSGELGNHPLLARPGAFGENISTLGLVEDEVCIGDRYRLGTALVEVSQGRQPCWKLGHRFDRKQVPATVVKTRRSGWYYRVVEAGEAQAGDRLSLENRPAPEWPVSRVFGLLIAGEGRRDQAAVRALTTLAPLAVPWKRRAAEMLA